MFKRLFKGLLEESDLLSVKVKFITVFSIQFYRGVHHVVGMVW